MDGRATTTDPCRDRCPWWCDCRLKERTGPYEPRPWESAGSEAALTAMAVVETRERLSLRAEKPRRLFGRPLELG